MSISSKKLILGVVATLAFPSLVSAEGFYATAQLGVSQQASDSEPYGNNIAVDSDFPSEFDAGDGSVGAIGLGYKINEQFRVEARVSYRDSSFNERKLGTGARDGAEYILNGDIDSTAFTVEGFYDFQNSTAFTPYIKAGLGMSDNSYSARLGGAGVAAFDAADGVADGYYDLYSDGSSTDFSWNVGVGGDIAISDGISLYGEYQYATFGDVNTGQDAFTDGFKIDGLSAHEVAVGLRVSF